ncbi:leucine-rich repeat protein 1 [Quercus suber]|uniref:Leucine-rich repeat protein 1 n=1 Tax=Quercus suber TaxID=58331 RepID=A0AAW0M3E6_QUESU
MAHQHRFLKHRMIERDTEREPQIVETGMDLGELNVISVVVSVMLSMGCISVAAYSVFCRTERIFCIICVYRRILFSAEQVCLNQWPKEFIFILFQWCIFENNPWLEGPELLGLASYDTNCS